MIPLRKTPENCRLTSSSSAAPSKGADGYLLQYVNHEKGGNKPARRRLQRLVRRCGGHERKMTHNSAVRRQKDRGEFDRLPALGLGLR